MAYDEDLWTRMHPYLLVLHQLEHASRTVLTGDPGDNETETYYLVMDRTNQQTLMDVYNILAVTNEAIITAMEQVRTALKLIPRGRRDKFEQLLHSKDSSFYVKYALCNTTVDSLTKDGEQSITAAQEHLASSPEPEDTDLNYDELQEQYPNLRIPKPDSRKRWIAMRYLGAPVHESDLDPTPTSNSSSAEEGT